MEDLPFATKLKTRAEAFERFASAALGDPVVFHRRPDGNYTATALGLDRDLKVTAVIFQYNSNNPHGLDRAMEKL